MTVYFCIIGTAVGSFILGMVVGNISGKNAAFQQMTAQSAQNDMARIWLNLFNDKEDSNVSQEG